MNCNLPQYSDAFIEEGFDSVSALLDITESDLVFMGIKRGHRRLLQRAIATTRGIPFTTPIIINYGYEEPDTSYTLPKPGTSSSAQRNDGGEDRRSRKRKQYVPSKPITAFHEYLNEVRAEFRDNGNMSSTDINRIAQDRWDTLGVTDKDIYERKALHANSDYVMDLISE
ncbi:hypothetical protein K501DRAFT_229742 [Backusella circina FSU 941]|nr:hypothetical protein K501DRAFT_229742 [Backusella circina FSU 941]